MIPKEFIDTLHQPFGLSRGFPGSGTLLAFKILMSAASGFVLVTSNRHLASSEIRVPSVVVDNVPAAARGIAHSEKTVAFAGDMTTKKHLAALGGNVLYVCANNHGSEAGGIRKIHMLAPHVSANYVATASVAYPDDFVTKIKKAWDMDGFRFIEVFAPSPYLWKYEPSMTIEVALEATKCAIWPVVEVGETLNITRRPLRPSSVDQYFATVSSDVDTGRVQNEVIRRWKHLTDGRLV